MNLKNTTLWRGAFLSAALIGATASAGQIGINFTANTWFLNPADQPGVVAGANWNNIDGGSGAGLALHDDTGTLTSALLSFSSVTPFAGFSGTNTPNAATNLLYKGGLVGSNVGGEVSVSVTNIPYTQYDVTPTHRKTPPI
jgi:hypothetical protein